MAGTTVKNATLQKRYGFTGTGLPAEWQCTRVNMNYSVSGGKVTITPTTANGDMIEFRCSRAISLKALTRFILMQSTARNTNQRVIVELANSDRSTYARIVFDGADNPTTFIMEGQNKNNGNTPVKIAGAPTNLAYVSADVMLGVGQAVFTVARSNTSGLGAKSGRFEQNIPEADEQYFVAVRVENYGVAVGTNTILLDAVVCEIIEPMEVVVLGGKGDENAGMGVPVNVVAPAPVKNANRQRRYDFNGAVLPDEWSIVGALGSGISYTVSGGALNITCGTTANAEGKFRCMVPLKVKALIRFIAKLGTRVLNNNVFFEVVNAAGTTYAAFILSDTATNNINTASGGNANTAKSIGTPPTLTNYFVADMMLEIEQAFFSMAVADASTLKSCSALFDRNIPDMEDDFFVQIRVKNNATGPLTSHVINIDAVMIEDLEMMGVEVLRGGGDLNPQTGLPVNVLGTVTVGSHAVTLTSTTITGTPTVVGGAAAHAAAHANPLVAGGKANAAVPTDVDEGDAVHLRADKGGRQIVTVQASLAASGETDTMVVAPATPVKAELKASAAKVTKIHMENHTAAWKFLKLWNALAANVTLGTTPATFSIGIPPNDSRDTEVSLEFATGLTYAVTGGYALTDNTAIVLGDVTGIIGWL